MFARITWVDVPPERVDDLVSQTRSAAQPMELMQGFRGVVALVNRSTGAAMAGTYWASAAAMQASNEIGRKAREALGACVGRPAREPERVEFVVQERAAPPRAGTFARINIRHVSPDKLDAAIEYVRDQVVPAIKPLSGFQTAVVLINRDSGFLMAASVWASAADRAASARVVAQLRTRLGQIVDAPLAAGDEYELVLAEVKPGAAV